MLFKNPSKKGSNVDLIINGTQISEASSIKFLCVNITPLLKFNEHCKNLVARAIKEPAICGDSVRSTMTTSACWLCINYEFDLYFSIDQSYSIINNLQLTQN